MGGKLTLALGFAAGYVLGSKAGRERYEQIVGASRRLWSNQTVQSTAGVLQAQASDLVTKAKESDVVHKARQAVGRSHHDGGSGTSTSGTTGMYEPATTTTELYEPTTTTPRTDRSNGIAP
jgi:hypothetical protein